MPTVYRIQDADKLGPYRCGLNPLGWGNCDEYLTERSLHDGFCPGPSRDWNYTRGDFDGYVFAFPTIEALHVRFGWGVLSYLLYLGFRIVEIETPTVIVSHSRRQCVIPIEVIQHGA